MADPFAKDELERLRDDSRRYEKSARKATRLSRQCSVTDAPRSDRAT